MELSEEQIEALVAEAEAGYDIDVIIARRGLRERVDRSGYMGPWEPCQRPDEDMYRASHQMICPRCMKEYGKHPYTDDIGFDDRPFLRLLCNGDKVKL